MAVGLPLKTTYADGDVFSASDINDTNGTINAFVSPGTVQSNPILNSAFQIAQRGTSVSVAASTFPAAYTLDRWALATGANQASTVSRQLTNDTTNLPSIQYCARVQRNSGQTGTSAPTFDQSIETINSIPFVGKQVTMSFYARKGANYSPASSLIGAQLLSGTGTDQNVGTATGLATVVSSTPTLTTTWQRFTLTGTVAISATQLFVRFTTSPIGTAGADDFFEVTGVQIDIGSLALPFRTNGATFQEELAACQRYYYRPTNTVNYSLFGVGFAGSTSDLSIQINLPVTMRIKPASLETSAMSSFYFQSSSAGNTPTSVTLSGSTTPFVALVTVNKSGSFSGGFCYGLFNYESTGFLGFSAEL
jgi:hypothetical protein